MTRFIQLTRWYWPNDPTPPLAIYVRAEAILALVDCQDHHDLPGYARTQVTIANSECISVRETPAAILALINPEPEPSGDPSVCVDSDCTYVADYLTRGPADLSHDDYHDGELHANLHLAVCRADSLHRRCPTCERFERRLRV